MITFNTRMLNRAPHQNSAMQTLKCNNSPQCNETKKKYTESFILNEFDVMMSNLIEITVNQMRWDGPNFHRWWA